MALETVAVQVDRRALLAFMNEGLPEADGHHTAITGLMGEPLAVALILHHLNREGGQTRCITTKVTTGHLKGNRLDAWIDDGRGTLYQTEIKMWAGNAFGGLRLRPDADAATMLSGGLKQWARIWDEERQTFRDMSVGKVLTPMQQPRGHEATQVEPLACFWWMVQRPGGSPPWFSVPTSNPNFPQVHIFSLTAYLLSLDEEVLSLHMPLLTQRLSLLDRLFPR